MVLRILNQFGKHLDILILFCSSIFMAGVAYSSVTGSISAHDAHLIAIDHRVDALDSEIRDLPAMKQRIDDIADFMGVPKKRQRSD